MYCYRMLSSNFQIVIIYLSWTSKIKMQKWEVFTRQGEGKDFPYLTTIKSDKQKQKHLLVFIQLEIFMSRYTYLHCVLCTFFVWSTLLLLCLLWPKDPLEKEMATHSSVLAWRIPGTGDPDGLPSMGSHRVGHDWSDLAAAAAKIHWSGSEKSVFLNTIVKSRS